jgi:hypothetical protein
LENNATILFWFQFLKVNICTIKMALKMSGHDKLTACAPEQRNRMWLPPSRPAALPRQNE